IAVAADGLPQLLLHFAHVGSWLESHHAEIDVVERVASGVRLAEDAGKGVFVENDGAVGAEIEAEIEAADEGDFAAGEFGFDSRCEGYEGGFAGRVRLFRGPALAIVECRIWGPQLFPRTGVEVGQVDGAAAGVETDDAETPRFAPQLRVGVG